MPVDQAERVCLRDAELTTQPRGEIAVGVGKGNSGTFTASRFEVEVTSDYIMGRDPAEVFSRCVLRKSGQMPVRALTDQPGWRG